MTRSVTIVNTSNWEHEDYIVHGYQGHYPDGTRLRPGEHVCFTPTDGMTITLEGVAEKNAVPFYDADGKQDWPRVEIHKPKGSGPE